VNKNRDLLEFGPRFLEQVMRGGFLRKIGFNENGPELFRQHAAGLEGDVAENQPNPFRGKRLRYASPNSRRGARHKRTIPGQ